MRTVRIAKAILRLARWKTFEFEEIGSGNRFSTVLFGFFLLSLQYLLKLLGQNNVHNTIHEAVQTYQNVSIDNYKIRRMIVCQRN